MKNKFVSLKFVNRDACGEDNDTVQTIDIEVSRAAVTHIMDWYGAFHGGDDYDVFINGHKQEIGINGEFQPLVIDAEIVEMPIAPGTSILSPAGRAAARIALSLAK